MVNLWWIDADHITFAQLPGIVQDVGSIDWTRISKEVTAELGKAKVALELSDVVNLEALLTSLISVSPFA